MLKLNRLTDYAVVAMSRIAQCPDGLCTAPGIAQETGVPLPTVSKLLNTLAHAELIASHRGAAGGYTLKRPAEEITVAEIIQALEGPIALTACVDGASGGCEVESFCPMRGNWDKVNKAIHGALSQVSLADMQPNPGGFLPGARDIPGRQTKSMA